MHSVLGTPPTRAVRKGIFINYRNLRFFGFDLFEEHLTFDLSERQTRGRGGIVMAASEAGPTARTELPEDVEPVIGPDAKAFQERILEGVSQHFGGDDAKLNEFVAQTRNFGKGDSRAEVRLHPAVASCSSL